VGRGGGGERGGGGGGAGEGGPAFCAPQTGGAGGAGGVVEILGEVGIVRKGLSKKESYKSKENGGVGFDRSLYAYASCNMPRIDFL